MKRIIALVLSLIVLFALCACAGGNISTDIPPADSGDDVQPSAPVPSEIAVQYENNNDEYCTYFMTLQALDAEGNIMWEYVSPNCMVGQCEGLEYLGMKNGLVYINESGIYDDERMNGDFRLMENHLRALNAADGSVAWDNADYNGAGSCSAFDDDGNIYVTGYFGPDCIKIAQNGSTVWLIPTIDERRYWAYELSYDNGVITITFEMNEDCEDDTVMLDADGNAIQG